MCQPTKKKECPFTLPLSSCRLRCSILTKRSLLAMRRNTQSSSARFRKRNSKTSKVIIFIELESWKRPPFLIKRTKHETGKIKPRWRESCWGSKRVPWRQRTWRTPPASASSGKPIHLQILLSSHHPLDYLRTKLWCWRCSRVRRRFGWRWKGERFWVFVERVTAEKKRKRKRKQRSV